jgi:hypothetical protein
MGDENSDRTFSSAGKCRYGGLTSKDGLTNTVARNTVKRKGKAVPVLN